MWIPKYVLFATLVTLAHCAPLSAVWGPPSDSDHPSRDWPVNVHKYDADYPEHMWSVRPDYDDSGSNRDWPVAVIDAHTVAS
ncbi:hypothetical protein IWW55_000669 [Coemansia sp. RSA 2706]|nr:hypothetical protein LPJ63_000304 [Coemansia sp. RSA 2711]KAJ2308021.1 hypothetical protein IWW55_000669 [Coemansia sp. RSA 2706]